jgi:hypothetical protein
MYPARAAAPTAADGLNYLLPVVVEGTRFAKSLHTESLRLNSQPTNHRAGKAEMLTRVCLQIITRS